MPTPVAERCLGVRETADLPAFRPMMVSATRVQRMPLRLALLLPGAFAARIAAAFIVERLAQHKGTLCLFDDTVIYWKLAEAMRSGVPYVVEEFGIPHWALRTPGYPLFLMCVQAVFGATNTQAARIVQAVLGTVSVGLVYGLARAIWPQEERRGAAVLAAGIAAFEPYTVAMSALLLSEAVFVPLMLMMLFGLAWLWRTKRQSSSEKEWWEIGIATLTGFAAGAAVMVRPSWVLAVPLLLGLWMLIGRSARSIRLSLFVALSTALVMSPWWIRNARVFGRFVPTATWLGASLYDGLNPEADGSSNMVFLERPEYRSLDEIGQDWRLTSDALKFALRILPRVAALFAIKAQRFWSPWPNTEAFRSTIGMILSGIVTIPLFSLLAMGVWDHRRDVRRAGSDGRSPALLLFASPVVREFDPLPHPGRSSCVWPYRVWRLAIGRSDSRNHGRDGAMSEDRTQPPSKRRREEARKRGLVPRSCAADSCFGTTGDRAAVREFRQWCVPCVRNASRRTAPKRSFAGANASHRG